MSVFNIPKSLLEAIDSVTNPTSWRRDLDIRPLVIIAGLSRHSIEEVYSGSVSDFQTDDSNAEHIHQLLEIPKPKSSRVAHSLNHYGATGSETINHYMWENYLHGSPIPSDVHEHIRNIKSVLIPEKVIDHLDHFKLYTGVQISPVATAGLEWNSTRPIKLLHLPAFTSTTTNFDVATRFTSRDRIAQHHESDHHGVILPGARHILELNFYGSIPDAASMIKHVGAKHEEEVLLGPNHTFELHPRPTFLSGYHDPLYVWKALSRGVSHEPILKQRDFTKSQ